MRNKVLARARRSRYSTKNRAAISAKRRAMRHARAVAAGRPAGGFGCRSRSTEDLVREALALVGEYSLTDELIDIHPRRDTDIDLFGNLDRILKIHAGLRNGSVGLPVEYYSGKIPKKAKTERALVYTFFRRNMVPILRRWLHIFEKNPDNGFVAPDNPYFLKLRKFCELHKLLTPGSPRPRKRNYAPTLSKEVKAIVDNFFRAMAWGDSRTCRYYVEKYPQYFKPFIERYGTPLDATDEERASVYPPLLVLPEPSFPDRYRRPYSCCTIKPSRTYGRSLARRLAETEGAQQRVGGENVREVQAQSIPKAGGDTQALSGDRCLETTGAYTALEQGEPGFASPANGTP